MQIIPIVFFNKRPIDISYTFIPINDIGLIFLCLHVWDSTFLHSDFV